MVNPIEPLPYNLNNNDRDWIHQLFIELWDQQQRLLDLGGVQREHSLYGPMATRLGWIYPPSHRFLIKPQALMMPEVWPDEGSDADTSFTSSEAVDGDTSIDSLGGLVVSQWRDVFVRRGRREIDFVVTKKPRYGGPQIALLIVELKRDGIELADALDQIQDYMKRILRRSNATGRFLPVYGLLVLGTVSIRIISEFREDLGQIVTDYLDVDNRSNPVPLDTDSVEINRWLVRQARTWANL